MDKAKIKDALAGNVLFATLPDSAVDDFASKADLVSFKLGETIVKRGELGEFLYVILSGRARVVDDSGSGRPVTLALLQEGSHFGERTVLYRQPASATVRSAGTTVVIRISAADLGQVVALNPALRGALEKGIAHQEEFNFLKTQKLLSGMTPNDTEALLAQVTTLSVAKGDFLFHEGDAGDAIYIVREGTVRLIKESEGSVLLGVARAGDLIGEMSLMFGQPRSAGAVAMDTVRVMRLARADFERVAGGNASVAELLLQQAKNRLSQNESILSRQPEERRSGPSLPGSRLRVGSARAGGRFSRKYPLAMTDAVELQGIACLAMVARFFDQPFQHESLEQRQGESGDDLYSLSRKAESAGFLTRLLKIDARQLATAVLPAAVENDDGELAIVYEIGRSAVVLAVPSRGLTRLPLSNFLDTWDGRLLTISYVPDFAGVNGSAVGIVRRFLPLLKPYLGLVARIVAISLLLQVFGLMPPFFTKILIDDVIVVGDMPLLQLMAVALVVVTFLNLLTGALRELLSLHLMRRLTGTLFVRFFGHVLSLPATVLNRWQTGDLINRFDENSKILETVTDGGMSVLANSLTLVVYLPVMFFMEPRLALFSSIFVASFSVLLIVVAPKVRAYEKRAFEAGSQRESHVIEVVKGIETVKSLAQEPSFAERGMDLFKRAMKIRMDSERFDNRVEMALQFLQQAHTIGLLGLGAYLVTQGEFSAGQLIAFVAVAGIVIGTTQALASFYDEWLELQVALDRVNDVLAEPRENNVVDAPAPDFKGHIRFENVDFSYEPNKGPPVLRNINLEIRAGQKVAFVGRSGSGKSTLTKLVYRLLEPTDGTLFIDDIDVSRLDLDTLRQNIGVVEQDPFIFSGTVRENLALAKPNLSLESLSSAATLAGIGGFVETLPMGYDTRIGQGGRSLSGGQIQRLTIARALAVNPRILVLDEATAALDNESERIIQNNLDKVMEGRTTLVVAHRLSTIRNADLIVVLDRGEIVEQGTHDSLMQLHGVYYYLNAQAEM